MLKINRITFVWNADFSVSGGLKALGELIEGEHSCKLCEIAYHRINQTKEWKEYRKELSKKFDIKIRQPCRNQLSNIEKEVANGEYPIVLTHTNKGVIRLLGSNDINNCEGEFIIFREKLDSSLGALLEKI